MKTDRRTFLADTIALGIPGGTVLGQTKERQQLSNWEKGLLDIHPISNEPIRLFRNHSLWTV